MGTKITAAQVMIVRVVSELAAVTMLRRAATGCDSSCANPRLPYIRTNSPATIARMDRPPSTKPQPSRSRWTVMNTDAASATTATAAVTHPSAAKFPNSEAAGQNTCWQTTKTASSPTTGQPQVRTNPRARSWISPRDFNARKVAPCTMNRATNSTPPSSANGPNNPKKLPFHSLPSLARPIAKFANPTPSTRAAVSDP